MRRNPGTGPSGGSAAQGGGTSPPLRISGHALFFPAATTYAIFVLPLSMLAMSGAGSHFPGLASASGHAHEMLFGFALAVVAGNQLGPVRVASLSMLLGLWVIARGTYVFAPASALAAAANIAFAALLAARLAPRLLGAAKKLRNQALPLVLTAICASGIGFQVALRAGLEWTEHRILVVSVLLYGLLMLFMGGRLIAPAVAGQFYRQGDNLDARVQPRIESALIIAMAVAVAAALADGDSARVAAAVALEAAGLLAALRLIRWRLWALRGRPDLLSLAAGYGWLAAGLSVFGAALAADLHPAAALHVITVGSLGTLTLNVMAMTWVLKARRDPSRIRTPVVGTVLLAVATLARALAGMGIGDPHALILASSLCWSSAFASLLLLMIRVRARPGTAIGQSREQRPAA